MAKAKMPVELRPLGAGDFAAWRGLWTAYLEFYESSVEDGVYRTTFARLLSGEAGEFQGALALHDGTPIGLVHWLFHRHCWKVENTCYLQDLYVAPKARGTGAGRALIEHVYGAADAAGAPSVYWLTQDFNAEARQLYDRIGTVTPFIKYNRRAA